MAKKKKLAIEDLKQNEAPATEQPITETLEKNYMPYAMSVIVSRAIPEIDGFKPSLEYCLPNEPFESINGCKSAPLPLVRRTIVSYIDASP